MLWETWWTWGALALVLAVLEIFAPGYVFLGFAIGAAVASILLLLGISLSAPFLLVVVALVALGAWIALRQVFGVRHGQKKVIDNDINEN